MTHKLPRRPLHPLLSTWSDEFRRLMRAGNPFACVQMAARRVMASRAENPERIAERPFRVMNQRRRLYACHWAGWTPSRTSTRWGHVGRLWLLSHRAPIKRRSTVGPTWLGGRP